MKQTHTYAIAWRDRQSRFVGYLRLEPHGMRLEGRDSGGAEVLRTVAYADIRSAAMARRNGSREITISLADEDVRVASLDQPGSLTELAFRLRHLTGSSHR